MACSPPGSPVHGILQASLLECVALPSPGNLPDPGMEPGSPALQVDSLPSERPGKPKFYLRKCNMYEIDMFAKFSCISSFYEAPVTVKKWRDCWFKNIYYHWEEKWNQILINVLDNSYCLKYQSKFFHWSCRIWNKHTKNCCFIARLCPTLVTSLTIACQTSRSIGFSRQEYWSVLPFPTLGDLPNPGIGPTSPSLAGGLFTTEPQWKPILKLETIYLK